MLKEGYRGKKYIDEKMGRDVTRKMSLKYELPDKETSIRHIAWLKIPKAIINYF